MKRYLEQLVGREDLGFDGAHEAMGIIMRGDANASEVAGFLVALRTKGETPAEIAGCVASLREHVVPVRPQRTDLTDIVGTGGDGANTFNISTAAGHPRRRLRARRREARQPRAVVDAGSADVLEALGVAIDLPPEAVATLIDEVGFGFMFAPEPPPRDALRRPRPPRARHPHRDEPARPADEPRRRRRRR